MEAHPLIDLQEVWKSYRAGSQEVHALRGLTLAISKGDFIAIRGPSGSGKSTAMNLIGCLDLPSKGRVLLDGKDISRLQESQLAQIRGRKIGFVFQQFNLIPTLSALDNVALPMLFQGVQRSARYARARVLLEQVDLADRMTHRPSELSGGQLQRVAIARALANDPEVILADEPTGNLDSQAGQSIMQLLADLHEKEGKTIVLVTHDAEIAKHARRTAFLLDGRIKEITLNTNKDKRVKPEVP